MLVTYLNRARIALRRSWLTYACAAVMASTSVVASANCPRAYPEVTFLQVWQDDAQLTVEDWEQHFSALGKLGFSDVVLQWTRYDKFSLWQDDGGNEAPVLDRIVEGATAAGVCLWIGLTYDPEFWEKAGQQEMDAVADYLDWRLEEAELQIRNLANVWRDTSPGPCGWYITDEFDDDTWGDPPRLALARDYVSALTATLKANADRPVTLSFFSNGNTTPEELGQFVDNLIGQAQIDKLYMQDGVGAGKLEPDEARLRLSQVAQAIAQPVAPIVELFVADGDEWVPGEFNRISTQLKTESVNIGAVFSASEHLISGKRGALTALGKKWAACLGQ